MAERTITVVCRDCGTTFEHVALGNKPKLLCPPCGLEAQRRSTREHKRRKRESAKVRYTHCPDCGGEYDKPRARNGRCDDCRKAHARAYLRQWKAERSGEPRQFFCVRCDGLIDRVGNSGRPKFCQPCGVEVRRENALRSEYARRLKRGAKLSTHCHHCGGELPRPYYSGRYPARCLACRRQRYYAWARERRAEARAHARCLDCGDPSALGHRGQRTNWCAPCRRERHLRRQRVSANFRHHARRAQWRGAATEKFTRESIFERDGWRCALCDRRIRRDLRHPHPLSASLDHSVPLARGGQHTRQNVRAAHLRCNLRKNARAHPVQLLLFP